MDNKSWLEKYQQAGFSFFNTGAKEKKIFTKWSDFNDRKPRQFEINAWLRRPSQNYTIVCGKISNLIVIDVDTKNDGDPTPFQNRNFYEVRTPSGGYHFYVLYDPIIKSTKHKKEYPGILKGVDIQSDRTLAFAPPSFFPGKGGYTLVNDAPIVKIPDDLLTQILEGLEPEEEANDFTPYIAPKNPESRRPGDIFNTLATWEEVLLPLGWTKVGLNKNGVQFWRRPGKKDGVSASTNWNGYDLFFPYTTSVDGLNQKRGYTKFNLLATLKYNGDYSRTAKSLVLENYQIVNKLV